MNGMIYNIDNENDDENEYCKNEAMKLLQDLLILYSKDDHKSICEILGLDYCYHSMPYFDMPINRYCREEMIYISNDNPCKEVRVHVEEDTKLFFKTLLLVTSHITDEKILMDLIIKRWIESVLLVPEQLYVKVDNNLTKKIRVKIGRDTWNRLNETCKKKGILARDGFKMAIYDFLR